LVSATSILVTLLFWTVLPSRFLMNELTEYHTYYEPVARNILAGRGFLVENQTPAILYPPGYPLILAGIFGLADLLALSEGVIVSAFILLSMSLTSVLVFWLARSVWGPLAGFISSLVWITHPFILWLTKQPNSEIPFMAFLYGGYALFWFAILRKGHMWSLSFFSGLLIGIAMLIRPIALGVGALLVATLWLVGRDLTVRLRLFLSMMVLLGNLVAVFPWEGWIYSQTSRVVPLSTIGGIMGVANGLTPIGYKESKFPPDVSVLMQDLLDRYGEMDSFGGIATVLAEEFQSRPLLVTKLLAFKAARSWYGTDSGRFETLILLLQIPYLVLILWGSYKAWKQGGGAKQLVISIWLMVLYFWGMSTAMPPLLRYMAPAIGLLIVLIPGILPVLGTQFRPQVGEEYDNAHSRHFGLLP
jgi:4-amino-4-deoxy-L-arabinose transferase-like glycosyltransferase